MKDGGRTPFRSQQDIKGASPGQACGRSSSIVNISSASEKQGSTSLLARKLYAESIDVNQSGEEQKPVRQSSDQTSSFIGSDMARSVSQRNTSVQDYEMALQDRLNLENIHNMLYMKKHLISKAAGDVNLQTRSKVFARDIVT